MTATDNNNAKATSTITVNVNNQSFDYGVQLDDDVANTVTVLRVGSNLMVRTSALGPNLIPETRIEDVGTLTINGGNLADLLVLDPSLNTTGALKSNKFIGTIVFNGGEGNDQLDGSKITVVNGFRVECNGGLGDDTATGGAEIDVLNGGEGNDSLAGGMGADAYLFGDADSLEVDTVTELKSAGTKDHLDFSDVSTAVIVNLGTTTGNGTTEDQAVASHANRIIKTAVANQAQFFENVTGGLENDSILGNSAANSLAGGAGNDTVRGAAGNDSLDGGDGNDFLFGDAGNDSVVGGGDDDVLVGDLRTSGASAGKDSLFGNAGEIRFSVGSGVTVSAAARTTTCSSAKVARTSCLAAREPIAFQAAPAPATSPMSMKSETWTRSEPFTTELNDLLANLP